MVAEENWVDVDLTSYGTLKTPKNDKIALIDADTVVYASCCVFEYENDDTAEWEVDIESAMEHAKSRINDILDSTGCKDYELHFTAGRKSFRYEEVDSEYKANRTNVRSVPGLYELKTLLKEENSEKSFIWYSWEADDMVVSLKRDNPDKYTLCAVDKDVLYTLEGEHFNYYSSFRFNIPMKFINVDAEQAMKHHYKQCLTGDKGDNVIGLKGIGDKTADKLLKMCSSPEECWKVVEGQYGRFQRTDDALKNMRLVNMHQLELIDGKYEVKLWSPSQSTTMEKID
jgi:5'-3' exonuclease